MLLYFTLALALLLMLACRNRGVIASGVLFNFWLLLMLCGFPEFRYRLNRHWEQSESPDYDFCLYMIYYPLVVLEWLLSCFADNPKYRVEDVSNPSAI